MASSAAASGDVVLARLCGNRWRVLIAAPLQAARPTPAMATAQAARRDRGGETANRFRQASVQAAQNRRWPYAICVLTRAGILEGQMRTRPHRHRGRDSALRWNEARARYER